ncbi:MAG: HEAT repeat domain-containing protein [Anaerolineae bacterium]|nr:HEAT repeat domain-containing protein [Gemmatimonadaceae bacterium]
MMRSTFDKSVRLRAPLCLAAVLALAAPSVAGAQTIASRVAAIQNGTVEMSIPAKSGVCGDDRDIVGFRRTLYIWPSLETHGTWSGVNCVPGNLRVRLTLKGGSITTIRTHVGDGKRSNSKATADLGVVPAAEAADYFLSLASRLDGRASKDAIIPAVLADDVKILPALSRISRDASRPKETRHQAIRWIGEMGEDGALLFLNELAAASEQDMNIREHALMGLAYLPDGQGVTSLIRIARSSPDRKLREKGIFWLSQAEDPAARRTLREMASSNDVPEDERGHVIFALGHHDPTEEDGVFLRSLYSRTTHTLKDKIIQSVAQGDEGDDSGGRWLLALAANEAEPMELRKNALFWAGQSEQTSVEDLIKGYSVATEPQLKEHHVFVLSQREESKATDKLMDIARNDDDPEARKKALFWLGQTDDPRVAKFLQQMILKR